MKYVIAVLIFSLLPAAHANLLGNSFFWEPYVGYKYETTKLTDLTGTSVEFKSNAPTLGLKLGFRSLSGIDVNLYGEMTQGKSEISNLTQKSSFTKKTTGFQLGVNSLGLIKMYLGTSLTNDFAIEDNSQFSALTMSGPSYHAGLMLHAYSNLNFGVQYTLNQYNKIKGSAYALGEKIDSYYSKVDTQDYIFFISGTF